MQRAKWFRAGIAGLILLCTCSALPSVAAQEPAPDIDNEEDQKITPALIITATLNENGSLTLMTYALGLTEPSSDLKPALEAAFRCAFKDAGSHKLNSASYFAKCRLPASGSGLLHEYRFATAPLRNYALHHELELLGIQLTLPDTEVRETAPPTKGFDFSQRRIPEKTRRHFDAVRSFSWRVDSSAIPESVLVRVGYDSAAVQRRAALLLSALLLPILLAFWLRRRAVNARVADKPSVWFSYIRCQQWLLNGSLVAWWASAETAHLSGYLRFLLSTGPSQPTWILSFVSALASWMPPVALWVVCTVISQPVQEKLRGLSWTRKELALQAIYSLCSALLPLLLIIRGFVAATRGEFRVLMVCLVAAFLVKLVAANRLVKLLGIQPQALTTGELRDAAFNVAHRLGVKLQQVYVIPAGKVQMANAFARKGNTIAFTDYLLRRMSRREVNYILGHELSHLRLKHLQKLSFAIVGGLFACTTAQMMMFRTYLPDSVFVRYGLFFVIMTAGPYFWSRRFEFQADAGAVETTGDPEGAISALFKLSSLNMHPLQWSKWSEKWLTHPSTLRRAQAIAKKAKIPVERIPEIAQTAVQQDSRYAIPPSAIAGNKLHSSTKKMNDVRWITFTMLGAKLLIPTAFALLVKFVSMSPSSDRMAYLVGAIVTLAVYLLLFNIISTRRLRSIIPMLKSKLQTEGVQVEGWRGVPVALAPAAVPRTYEGHLHWDLGFLFIQSDRICYWGEETRFTLRREQISDIKTGPGSPVLLALDRIYVAWRDTERSTCGVFSLASAEPGTLLALRRRTKDLLVQLLQWYKESSTSRSLPQPLNSLSTPQFGNVTGRSPLELWKASRVVRELYLTALIAAGVAVFAGLRFHVQQFLADPNGFSSHPHAPGSGWYVVLVAVTIRLIQYLPFFSYKEVPVVQASLAGSRARRAPSPDTTEPKREPEPAIR